MKKIYALNVKLCCFSTNCIVGIKPLKTLLPTSATGTSTYYSYFKFNCIEPLSYVYTHKCKMMMFLNPSANTSRVVNVKSQVYSNKSCTTMFCRCGYRLKENDYYLILQNNNTYISSSWQLGVTLQDCIYKSIIAISPNKLIVLKINKSYFLWMKSHIFRFHESVETTIEYDNRNEWLIVVTCNSR